ncbi:hypothetical protein A2Z33_03135 [Candidatus Gottesmanbacteria bacterium RBG_16_52_11]|uniref:Cation tolerance protein CutA n=1 Tax=Candidatus Gottesmanbacteria bacterium RBG_16_52_11 TaxID=1798374 RepID=A0A1F5YW57_9BACT|nr:MAG: hypothetical protein A2Z33_03135 [Candidatus Gottesmanbacteria bacterium RBG_16_52_11]
MKTYPLTLTYITCKDESEAMRIGTELLRRRLCGCINIIPAMTSVYFWPPESDAIEEAHETVLIAKTIPERYPELEQTVLKIHSYDTPCVMAIPVSQVADKYYRWLMKEMEGSHETAG